MNREPVYAAAFAFFNSLTLGNAPAFATATRKADTWEGVAPEECPALLFTQGKELAVRRTGFPTVWKLYPRLMLYVHTAQITDPTVIASQLLNPLLDAIEAALEPLPSKQGRSTLGGLVSHCAIEGAIEIMEGNLGDVAVAVIPLEILTSP